MNPFDISRLEKELQELEKQTLEENFWNDTTNSTKILTEIKDRKNKWTQYNNIKRELTNLQELTDLVKMEFDEELAKEIIKNTKKANKEIEKLEVTTLLSGKYDRNNAIVTIHQVQEELSLKIGQKCCIECILGGRLKIIMK